jgi:hypothetical protein
MTLMMVLLVGCGGISSREITPSEYELSASGIYAHDGDLAREAAKACPDGYKKTSEQHEPFYVAEVGPWWRWHIICKRKENSN